MTAATTTYAPHPARGLVNSGQFAHFETAVVVTGYLIFGTAIIKQFLGGNQPVDPPIVKLAFLAYYALIGLLMALRPAPLITGMKRNALFGMFLLLPLASVTWSIHPDATLARAIAVSGCSLFGLYVALYLPAPRALWLLALAGLIGAVISFMLIVALPSFGIAQGGPWAGTWVGAHGHKNALGGMSAIACLAALAVLKTNGPRRAPLMLASLGLNFVLLVGSKSLTSLLMFMLAGSVLVLLPLLIRPLVRQWALVLLIVLPPVLAMLLVISIEDIAALLKSMGKDPTMSSRLPIWENLVPYIQKAFWLGYGYEAFWEPSNWPVRIIEFRLHFRPAYSHNGVFEQWLNLGMVGVVFFALLLVRFLSATLIALYRRPGSIVVAFTLAFSVVFLMTNFSESSILARNNIQWVLFVVAYMWIAARDREATE